MGEATHCPSCGQPMADGSDSCSHCGYGPGAGPAGSSQQPPRPPDIEAGDVQGLAAEGRRLHPLTPLVFAVSGVTVGFLAALVAGPELGVALGLLGGGLGVWALLRSGLLR